MPPTRAGVDWAWVEERGARPIASAGRLPLVCGWAALLAALVSLEVGGLRVPSRRWSLAGLCCG